MPGATILDSVETLGEAFGPVRTIVGSPGEEESPGSGLLGVARMCESFPPDLLSGAEDLIASFGLEEASSGLGDLLRTARESLEAIGGLPMGSPEAVVRPFLEQFASAKGIVDGKLRGTIADFSSRIGKLAAGLPAEPAAIASEFADRIIAVLSEIEGPSSDTVRAWASSVQAMKDEILPLIADPRYAADPGSAIVEIVSRSLSGTLEAFGYGEAGRILAAVDAIVGTVPSAGAGDAFTAACDAALRRYGEASAALAAPVKDFKAFRASVELCAASLETISAELISLGRIARVFIEDPLLATGALENALESLFKRIAAVVVEDAKTIEDPFSSLLERIDSAIASIDAGDIAKEVGGFMDGLSGLTASIDSSSAGEALRGAVSGIAEGSRAIEASARNAQEQLRLFVEGLASSLRDLAQKAGSFDAEGNFSYFFEATLRENLDYIRKAVSGDPGDPSSVSLAVYIREATESLNRLLSLLAGMLDEVGAMARDAVTAASAGLEAFVASIGDLHIRDAIGEAETKIGEIVEGLGAIDFSLVVDPVIGVIDENKAKLSDIDVSSLDATVRSLLAAALDAIMDLDLSERITPELRKKYGDIKTVPEEALATLQGYYEKAMEQLDRFDPVKLLDGPVAALEGIAAKVADLNPTVISDPLDRWFDGIVLAAIDRLDPSALVAPLVEGFGGLTSLTGKTDGASLLKPLVDALEEFKSSVTELNLDAALGAANEAFAAALGKVEGLKPSTALGPIVELRSRIDAALDRIKPSALAAPAVELAGPLRGLMESVRQESVDALFGLFKAPREALETLKPEILCDRLAGAVDSVAAALDSVSPSSWTGKIAAAYFDLKGKAAALAAEDPRFLRFAEDFLNPSPLFEGILADYDAVLGTLRTTAASIRAVELGELYEEASGRLLALLPPYARKALDADAFKSLMRLADPTAAISKLDERFEELKRKIMPIDPAAVTAELDDVHAQLVTNLSASDPRPLFQEIAASFAAAKATVADLRVDFLATDIDAALSDFRAMVAALDPSRMTEELESLFAACRGIAEEVRPTKLLAGISAPIERFKAAIVPALSLKDLRQTLESAWEPVAGTIEEIDVTRILSPIIDKLDELETGLEDGLVRVEESFDGMLGAAKAVLSGTAAGG